MNHTEKEWAQSIADQIAEKLKVTASRNRGKIPYSTKDGKFDDWSDPGRVGWWTNGFWPAQLWLLYHAYGNEKWKEIAREVQDKLDDVLMDPKAMDHDSGFRFLISDVADYRITGNEKGKIRGLVAASDMAGRYNLAGKLIRAWNDPGTGENAGIAIIDCMMNLPLLYWASDVTKDPRFRHIALAHADRAMEVFVRENGSCHHIVEFDPENGSIVGPRGGQGIAVGSSWTRGQAWALYGFTLSYIHTNLERYLNTAQRVADYFISQIPESGLIPVDFDQAKEILWEDSTAAAIAACGLLELEKYVSPEDKQKYHNAALLLLRTLAEKRCDLSLEKDSLIEKCTAAYHDPEHDFTIIYGDYFFTEAILKVAEKDIMLW